MNSNERIENLNVC